jgi:pimeloyl-ACP methyl ester carboxylesterase
VTSSLNEFNVREQPIGGGLLYVVKRRGSRLAYKSLRMIILVHGFDVPQQSAAESLGAFRERLLSRLSGSGGAEPSVWAFYWPGDLSRAAFPAAIPRAELAGERLGELLTTLDPAQQVVLIGHSLGCRVVLQALHYVADAKAKGRTSADVPLACLLAAAVPIGRCAGNGAPYRREVIKNTVHVLFSRADGTLRSWFRVGQALYENMGEAVGLNGLPGDRWTDPFDTGLKHKDYWSADTSVNKVAEIIAPTRPRGMATWHLPSAEPPEGRRLEARGVTSRALGDDLDSAWTDCWPTAGAS